MSQSQQTPPGESHVHQLFGFALGMVAGHNAAKLEARGLLPDFEDLPRGYSIGGTKLDHEAGDALLQMGSNWFLIEMKRAYPEAKADLAKARVVALQEKMEKERRSGNAVDQAKRAALLRKAETAHQLLYLCTPKQATKVPMLRTLGYLGWLQDVRREGIHWTEWLRRSASFTSFLSSAGKTPSGFSAQELAAYIAFMNGVEGETAGVLSEDDVGGRIAIAVDSAGMANAFTYRDVRAALELHPLQSLPATPASSNSGTPKRVRPR